MTVNAYSHVDDRRLWTVNRLVELDRPDLIAELTGAPQSASPRRRRLRARRSVRG